MCWDLALCYSSSHSPSQLLTFVNVSMLTLFGVFVDAPAAMSTPHVSLWPHSDARCRAVEPCWAHTQRKVQCVSIVTIQLEKGTFLRSSISRFPLYMPVRIWVREMSTFGPQLQSSRVWLLFPFQQNVVTTVVMFVTYQDQTHCLSLN